MEKKVRLEIFKWNVKKFTRNITESNEVRHGVRFWNNMDSIGERISSQTMTEAELLCLQETDRQTDMRCMARATTNKWETARLNRQDQRGLAFHLYCTLRIVSHCRLNATVTTMSFTVSKLNIGITWSCIIMLVTLESQQSEHRTLYRQTVKICAHRYTCLLFVNSLSIISHRIINC